VRAPRPLGVLMAGVLASLVLAGGAMAAQPEVLLKNDPLPNDSFVDTWTCPGLEILNEIEGKRSRMVYFDQQGHETRLVIHVRYRMWFTNLANAVTLSSPGTRKIELDFVNGTWTETGVYRAVTANGEGNVLHQSGRLVEGLDSEELISLSGPHHEYLGQLEQFCAALGG
jgi:hypothetical protein